MTTSEVIRQIRENSEVRDEVRRLILTEDMLAMPARLDQISRDVAALAETAKQHGERLVQHGERMDQLAAIQVQQAAMLARMDERLVQHGELLARMDERLVQHGERMDQHGERLDQQGERLDRIDERLDRQGGRLDQHGERLDRQGERLDRIDERLDRQGADIEVLKTDVGVLKTDVGVLKTDVGVLKTDVGVLKTDMRVVKGVSLEAYLHVQMSRRAANLFTLRRIAIVRGPLLSDAVHDFEDEITDALKRNAISDDQHGRVFDTDLIIRGLDRESSKPTYVAIEAAFTIGDDDIRKASDTVTALRAVFKKEEAEIIGAIHGINIAAEHFGEAEKLGLVVVNGERPS